MTSALIAGGGIGGLTAALSLHAAGFRDVLIAEASARAEPSGVGLNILPSATRELAALGLLGELSARAVHTRELRLVNRQGTLIWSEPRGTAAGYAWPQLSVHRETLRQVLLHAVRQRLGPDTVMTGSRVTGAAQSGDRVTVTIAGGAGQLESRLSATVAVGADGLYSAVRRALHPGEDGPLWNGWVMWRGTGRAEQILDGQTMIVAGDSRLRVVVYPLTPPGPAGTIVNWVVAAPAARPGQYAPSGRDARRLARDHAAGCCPVAGLDVPALISSTPRVLEYPMTDRDPLPWWSRGGITLLGDAAHPMYPAGSNGATQAIIDARALAYHLAAAHDPGQGLQAYDQDRRPATARIQLSNREMGPEAVINLAHARAPGGFTDITQVLAPAELEDASRRYAQTGGLTLDAVNRPSPYSTPRAPAGRT